MIYGKIIRKPKKKQKKILSITFLLNFNIQIPLSWQCYIFERT
jgi:hypothetical protein